MGGSTVAADFSGSGSAPLTIIASAATPEDEENFGVGDVAQPRSFHRKELILPENQVVGRPGKPRAEDFTEVALVRLHGRNRATWNQKGTPLRGRVPGATRRALQEGHARARQESQYGSEWSP
jgi:hypothetical protein